MSNPAVPSSGFWERAWRRLDPTGTRLILEDPSLGFRVFVLAGVGSAGNAVVAAAICFAFHETLAVWVGVITAATYVSATVFLLATGRLKISILIILWVSVANSIAVHLILGGFAWSGVALGWGVLVTAASALSFFRGTTISIASVYLVAAIVLALLEPTIRATRDQPPVALTTILALDMFVVSLLILVPMTAALVGQMVKEQARANSLLLNVLPGVIATRLKTSPGVIADRFEECTVLFADLVGFTSHSARVAPERLVSELNTIFSAFDELVRESGVEKIKTIGDGYMAVAGVPVPREDHLTTMCDLALAMQAEMAKINQKMGTDYQLRVGLHTGPVVAGVIGESRFSYDLWGDTVNLASRMESRGRPGRVQTTAAVRENAGDEYIFQPAGMIDLRGRQVEAYFLEGRRSVVGLH
ncbi:MAG: adenylate/guanylate cyclase domain-containing protein [Acidimicrobiia bacterium]